MSALESIRLSYLLAVPSTLGIDFVWCRVIDDLSRNSTIFQHTDIAEGEQINPGQATADDLRHPDTSCNRLVSMASGSLEP